jgi:hypothetical protein
MITRPPDPYRAQLDERWRGYLDTHERSADHSEWIGEVFANYRDEIVHFGAQLLNDRAIRPWDERSAFEFFERYRTTACQYDSDPDAWEQSHWNQIRDGLPAAMRERWTDSARRREGQ